jgi:hypothetical protein
MRKWISLEALLVSRGNEAGSGSEKLILMPEREPNLFILASLPLIYLMLSLCNSRLKAKCPPPHSIIYTFRREDKNIITSNEEGHVLSPSGTLRQIKMQLTRELFP